MDFIKSLLSRKRFWIAIVYVALLTWSGIYRSRIPERSVPGTKKIAELNAVGDGNLSKIKFAYQETNSNNSTDKTPIILVHGSPGSSEAFDGLVKFINDRRIISVDLPGFGHSEMNIPDYSIKAHAKYLIELMDKLKIERAHFVGFSLGGGVILELQSAAPENVESITFIASIGVQEYELLENFYANRIVHAAQLGFFWFLKEFTPHFGIFDGMAISYARNFYDTDQRPLRGILENLDIPVQIIHGKDDPLVPVEAAREHARIVPQSDYHELDDNHFFVFMRPEKIEKTLQNFWTSVENGTAITRTSAKPERVAQAKNPFDGTILKAMGATAIVFFLIILILAAINEDLAFVFGGIFAAQERFGLLFAIIAGVVGSGIWLLTWTVIGRRFGTSKSDLKPDSVKSIFNHRIFGFRLGDYLASGKSKTKFFRQLFSYLFSATVRAIVFSTVSLTIIYALINLRLMDITNTAGFLTIAITGVLSLSAFRLFNAE